MWRRNPWPSKSHMDIKSTPRLFCRQYGQLPLCPTTFKRGNHMKDRAASIVFRNRRVVWCASCNEPGPPLERHTTPRRKWLSSARVEQPFSVLTSSAVKRPHFAVMLYNQIFGQVVQLVPDSVSCQMRLLTPKPTRQMGAARRNIERKRRRRINQRTTSEHTHQSTKGILKFQLKKGIKWHARSCCPQGV